MAQKKKKQQYKYRVTLLEIMIATLIVVLVSLVSLLAYSSYIKKASNSNAISELKQAQEVILSTMISAEDESELFIYCDGVKFEYNLGIGKVIFSGSPKTNDNGITFTKELHYNYKYLNKLSGSFSINGDVITYTTEDGRGTATWKSGELPKPVED